MEFLSSIVGLVPCFYERTSKHTVYIRDMKKNLHALSKEMNALDNLYKDVKERVEDAERRQMRRRNEVGGWILEVEDMAEEVHKILQRGEQEIQKRCVQGCCPRNCWSSYKIGKGAEEKLVAVSDLIGKGDFDVVAHRLPGRPVDELPIEEIVAPELLYDAACGFLEDPQVGMIGIYGMGGVGKTTLLKKINNDFLTASNDFDVVIWAVISKPFSIEKIQEVIWNKLQIPRDIWETRSTQEEKAIEILRVLKTKKFVLLFDDIWEPLHLLEMGVPRPDAQNKSKIIFTTRSQDVCHQMKARSIEVKCLSFDAAWALFQKEVGEETLNSHPHMPGLAKVLVEECNGLPLALVTLGRAMRGEKDPSNWDKVTQDLSKFPTEISGMENKLFHRLKVSYDRLSDDVIKSCFLYCSLYPEDREIICEGVVELWIGEGLLGEVHDIHETRNQGYKIIKKLKDACLLESCGLKERRVKMHDVIHDMALWLYGECGKEKKKVLVYNDVSKVNEAQEIAKLKDTKKMSLWDNNTEEFPETLVCPNLETLIIEGCHKLKKFSSGFFRFMPLIRVLDLSNNDNLSELPVEIGKLVALKYLNLSYTKIRELPIELTNLESLLILLLDGIESLEIIPRKLVSSLISLKFFSMCNVDVVERTLLDELESLNCISAIGLTICTTLSFDKLKSSHKLQRCLSYLQLSNYDDTISFELSPSILKRMEYLQWLVITNCNDLKDIKIEQVEQGKIPNYINVKAKENHFHALHNVTIQDCSNLFNLTWLVYVPYLEQLYVTNCESIEEVICLNGGEENINIFSRLKYLKLDRLPRLKSIYQHPLPFPSLKVIKVYDCNSLKSLPFDSNTWNRNLKKIKGEETWWNQLEWDDEVIKNSFSPYFQIHIVEPYVADPEQELKTSDINDMPAEQSSWGLFKQFQQATTRFSSSFM